MDKYYNKAKNSYIVYKNNKAFTYSLAKYGKCAKLMAKYSLQTGTKIKNWFKDKDNYIIIYSYYKPTDKYKKILIDKEDYDKVKDYYWGIDKHRSEFYAITSIGTAGKNKKKLRMHRLIMNPNDNEIIDHIKGNGLDNRKSNLRYTDVQGNNLNKVNLSKLNQSGTTGVHEHKGYMVSQWVNTKTGKKHQKCFKISKYGKDRASELASTHREQMEKLYYNK